MRVGLIVNLGGAKIFFKKSQTESPTVTSLKPQREIYVGLYGIELLYICRFE